MSSIVTDNPTNTTTDHVIGSTHERLFYLHDLENFKVHHDDPDVRGWTVKLADGSTVGTIENLIVDKAARKVRYLEVTADRDRYSDYRKSDYYLDNDSGRVFDGDHDEHFIMPIGMVRLDHSDRDVYVEGIDTSIINEVPRYRRGSKLNPNYELATVNYFSDRNDAYSSGYDRTRYANFDSKKYKGLDDSFYTSGYFDDKRFYDRHQEARTAKAL